MRPELSRMNLDKLKEYKDYLVTEGAHAPYKEPRTKKVKGEASINFEQEYYTREIARVDHWLNRRTREAIENAESEKAWLYLYPSSKFSRTVKGRIKTFFTTLLTKGFR